LEALVSPRISASFSEISALVRSPVSFAETISDCAAADTAEAVSAMVPAA
jgi:hypothetical protein